MDQDTINNKQRIIMSELSQACTKHGQTKSWIQHFDEAVRIQSEIGHPHVRSSRYTKTREITELLRDKPKCHGPNDLVKITPQSIHERHDFIFLMLDTYSKFKHTYSEQTCSDLQMHILDVAEDACWQFQLFCENNFRIKPNHKEN